MTLNISEANACYLHQMTNKTKFSKGWAVKNGVALILIIGFIVWQKYWPGDRRKVILDGAFKEQFNGKVDSIFRDKPNHNTLCVKISDGYVYGIYADWESKINLGDSLSKSRGSLIVKVYKKDGRETILDYRQLVKNIRK